jgi:hypothetical protein
MWIRWKSIEGFLVNRRCETLPQPAGLRSPIDVDPLEVD